MLSRVRRRIKWIPHFGAVSPVVTIQSPRYAGEMKKRKEKETVMSPSLLAIANYMP
jgi:hypothetical protein